MKTIGIMLVSLVIAFTLWLAQAVNATTMYTTTIHDFNTEYVIQYDNDYNLESFNILLNGPIEVDNSLMIEESKEGYHFVRHNGFEYYLDSPEHIIFSSSWTKPWRETFTRETVVENSAPVPEPATLLLFGVGVLAIIGWDVRK